MLPLRRACQTVGYACLEKIYLASLGKHRNSLQSRLRSRISFFYIFINLLYYNYLTFYINSIIIIITILL